MTVQFKGWGAVLVILLAGGLMWWRAEQRRHWHRVVMPQTRMHGCETNLGQIGVALKQFQGANQGRLPGALSEVVPARLSSIPTCPSAARDTYSAGFQSAPGAYTLICTGHHHRDAGLAADRPAYSSRTGFVR